MLSVWLTKQENAMSLVAEPIWNQLAPLVFKASVGFALTGLLGVIMWPIRKIKKEWADMKAEQVSMHSELVLQRTNCLSTLQAQGVAQIELLTKVAGSLEHIALSQAEMTGFFKASAGLPIAPRRTRKK